MRKEDQRTMLWESHWLRVAIGTLVSLVFLYLAVKDVPLQDVAQTLARVNYGWVLLAIVGIVAQSWLRAVRWIQLYYPMQAGLRIGQMLGIVLIGQMLNIVVPWRSGEFARIYLAREIGKRSLTQTAATLGVEKFFDTLMLLALLVIIPPFMTLPGWLEGPREGLILLTAVLLAVAFALLISRDRVLRVLGRISLPWIGRSIGKHAEMALGSLDVLRRWDRHLGLQVLSALIWLLGVLVNYLAFLALGLQLPLIGAFLLLAVLQVGGLVPSSPGKVGVFQYLCIRTLALFAVNESLGLSYGILLYLIAYGTPVILGILFLWWGGVNLRGLAASQAEGTQ